MSPTAAEMLFGEKARPPLPTVTAWTVVPDEVVEVAGMEDMVDEEPPPPY